MFIEKDLLVQNRRSLSGGISSEDNIKIMDSGKNACHPCYSGEGAKKLFSRIHLPVAPSCNIRCNYCSRRYDCVNESRPGVTSSILSPEEAVSRVIVLKKRAPGLSVAAVAGPGDPLANIGNTLKFFTLVRKVFPEMLLCLSTNGLMLPEYTDALHGLSVSHITITINAVDTEVGSAIYRAVDLNGRFYTGEKAAAILISRQIESLMILKKKGIFVKVNSVLIPGINSSHMHKVSKVIKGLGAFIHNIVPYIPSGDTHFDRNRVPAPTPAMLDKVQRICGSEMKIMRHCRQCRADAAGMLNQGISLI